MPPTASGCTSPVGRSRPLEFLPLEEFEHVGSERAAIGGATCAPRVTHSDERCSLAWRCRRRPHRGAADHVGRRRPAVGCRLRGAREDGAREEPGGPGRPGDPAVGSGDRARSARHGGDNPAPVSRTAAYRGVAHLCALAARQAGDRRPRRGRDASRGRPRATGSAPAGRRRWGRRTRSGCSAARPTRSSTGVVGNSPELRAETGRAYRATRSLVEDLRRQFQPPGVHGSLVKRALNWPTTRSPAAIV